MAYRLARGLATAMVTLSIFPGWAGAAPPEPAPPTAPDDAEEPAWQEGPATPSPDPPPKPAPPPTTPAPYPYHYPPGYRPPPPYWPGAPVAQPPVDDGLRTDPLLPVGITFLSIGGLVGVSGALLLAAADEGDPVCSDVTSVPGCVDRPAHDRQIAGGALVGGAIGFVGVAIPAIILGHSKVPREGYRYSHGMTAAGAVFANIGAGVAGIGAGAMIADATYGALDARIAEATLMAAGGALLGLGAALWGVGAQRIDDDGPTQGRAP